MRNLILFVAVAVVTPLTAADAVAPHPDVAKLQGTWKLTWIEAEGKSGDINDKNPSVVDGLTFDDNKMTINLKKPWEKETGTYTLVSDGKLNRIKITDKDNDDAHGIYTLDGDSLTLVLNMVNNGKKPESFKTAAADGFATLKLSRVKK
jgi:uncharacterized protein (TIGR03067 family)